MRRLWIIILVILLGSLLSAVAQQQAPVLEAKPKKQPVPKTKVGGKEKKKQKKSAIQTGEAAVDQLAAGNYRIALDLNFFLGFPRGEFKENNTHVGVGLDGSLFYHFPRTPLLVGLNVSFNTYGTTRRRTPLSTTIPDVEVEVERSNNYLIIAPVVRFQGQLGWMSAYVEAGAGLSNLYTETKVKDWETDKEVVSSRNLSDVTWNWWVGAGIGTVIYAGEYMPAKQLWVSNPVLLQFGFRWLSGGEAEYLTPGDVDIENGSVSYNVRFSRTDLLVFLIGISFRG